MVLLIYSMQLQIMEFDRLIHPQQRDGRTARGHLNVSANVQICIITDNQADALQSSVNYKIVLNCHGNKRGNY